MFMSYNQYSTLLQRSSQRSPFQLSPKMMRTTFASLEPAARSSVPLQTGTWLQINEELKFDTLDLKEEKPEREN
jgi:hypothetical protein